MPKKLSAEQIAGYQRDGYVCPVDAFSPERARRWRERLEDFERAEGIISSRICFFRGSTRSCMRPKSWTRSRT
jgi:hypothetical protein